MRIAPSSASPVPAVPTNGGAAPPPVPAPSPAPAAPGAVGPSAAVASSRTGAILAAGGAAAAATPAPSPTEQLLMERMQAARTFAHVEHMAAEPRRAGSPEHLAAAEYVVEQLAAAGWNARIEEVDAGWRGIQRNVIADRPGSGPEGERGLVIAGAHLDSVSRAPGANDNASGSAILVEIGRALDGIDTRNDVRLMWFDGEERGLLGSRAYARAMSQEDRDRAIAMLNFDMVASPNGDVGFSVGARTTAGLGEAVEEVAQRTGITSTWRADERHSRSDHHSFDSVGIPSLDFGVSVRNVGAQDPNYHSPRDTPDKVNLEVLEGYGDLGAVALLELADRATRVPGAAPPRGVKVIHGPPL